MNSATMMAATATERNSTGTQRRVRSQPEPGQGHTVPEQKGPLPDHHQKQHKTELIEKDRPDQKDRWRQPGRRQGRTRLRRLMIFDAALSSSCQVSSSATRSVMKKSALRTGTTIAVTPISAISSGNCTYQRCQRWLARPMTSPAPQKSSRTAPISIARRPISGARHRAARADACQLAA